MKAKEAAVPLETYPFLSVMESLIVVFFWIIWFWLLITVFTDLFRRHDVSGWMKAAWTVFVIVLPYIGVLAYLITQSRGMSERSIKQAQTSQAQFDQYVRSVADGGGGAAAEIDKAKHLLDSGTITQTEFDQIKRRTLSTS